MLADSRWAQAAPPPPTDTESEIQEAIADFETQRAVVLPSSTPVATTNFQVVSTRSAL